MAYHAAPACRRRNHIQAAHVDAALVLKRIGPVRRAEKLMLREKVPRDVIDRVLAPGDRVRRPDDLEPALERLLNVL